MKKQSLIYTLCFLVIGNICLAGDGDKKKTLEIHAKASANSTFLFNNNISDAGDDQDYAAGWSLHYGGGVSMYFGNVGFGVEGLLGNHRAAYAGTFTTKDAAGNVLSTTDYSSNVNLKIMQIPVFFKLKSDIGGYLEVGPQYTMISEAAYHYTAAGVQLDTIMTNSFAKSYFSAVIGFGFKIQVAKSNFAILGGARLQYAFSDIQGVDALGREFANPFIYKQGAETTTGATAGLMLGVVYTLGNKEKAASK
ncbi:MAG: outer membrane beta-barrel protein [Bacteroidetes bacterium]|nr:outer membrane beta-barrel protein [Bacteroidota bacterium]